MKNTLDHTRDMSERRNDIEGTEPHRYRDGSLIARLDVWRTPRR